MKKFLKKIYKVSGLVILKKRILIFFNLLNRQKVKSQCKDVKSFGLKNKHVFFGYYDLNPISYDNTKILAIVVPAKKNTLSTAKIGYFDLNNPSSFVEVGLTETWCWQQGARLKWSNVKTNTIIYNNFYNDNYGCIFKNIETKTTIKQISYPIYDLTNDEKLGLSLNFSRLQRLRAGYGYSNLADKTKEKRASNDDGVFLIDVDKNTSKLIISLDKLSKIEPHESMENAEHYINHLSWNKSGTRFLFFHLWTIGEYRSSRLFTANADGSNLYLVENKEAVSHYDWKDDTTICLTTASKENGVKYSVYKDLSNERKILDHKELNKDGHPTYYPKNKNIILSDTYPDKYGERSLFIYNIKENLIKNISSFKSPIKYRSDYRCDLHPRFNDKGTIVSFDSTHTGVRTINTIDFENFISS